MNHNVDVGTGRAQRRQEIKSTCQRRKKLGQHGEREREREREGGGGGGGLFNLPKCYVMAILWNILIFKNNT
jgi:hypothetical protein